MYITKAGVTTDLKVSEDVTVDVPHGEVIIKNADIDGNLIIKNAGRVDFSGKAGRIIVEADDAEVYALDYEAEFASGEVNGKNSKIVTKSFADYQQADWEEGFVTLPREWADSKHGFKMAFAVCGPDDGIPIVLIHGLTDARVSWSQAAPRLAARGFRVYVPEYKGNGKTDKPYDLDDTYSVAELTRDIADFMDALGIESANIVGHSLGSIITQELNISYKDKVRTSTLIASGVRLDAGTETMDWFMNGDDEYKGIFAYDDTQKLPESFILAWGDTSNPDPDFREANFEQLRQVPYYAWKALTKNLLKFDNSRRLGEITGDVQIIWGSEDGVFPLGQQQELLTGLVNADVIFRVMKGADHSTHWCGYEVLDAIVSYIADFAK